MVVVPPAAIVTAAVIVVAVVVLPPLPSLRWWWGGTGAAPLPSSLPLLVWWWWCLVLLTCWPSTPAAFPSVLYPLPSPLFSLPFLPATLWWVAQVSFVRGWCWCREGNAREMQPRWAEFLTLTFFDRDFDFNHSTFSKARKIMKIIVCVIYIDGNAYKILVWTIVNCVLCCVVVSFQSYKISLFIEYSHRFSKSVNGHYKIKSHSQQNAFPRYMMEILGIRFSLRNLGQRTSLNLAIKDL